MRSERLLGALVLLLRCLQGDSAGDAASDAAAAVVGISGRSGNWIDSLCFKFRNGSEVTYHNKLENDGGSGGHRQGPWTLKDDEIIVNVTQWMRPGYWFNSHGLGDCLQMQTAVNGDESKTIVFEGNQIGPEHVSTSYTAPDGEQIVGLHFDGQRLISVDFAPFIAGCNMFNILLAMTMHNESAPVSTDCQKRLAVGATCAASCINAHANDEKAFEVFSCLAPGAAPRGQLPVCTGAQVTLVTASAMLAVIAALAAAVSGAYGGGRDVQNASIEDSGGEVPRKLSMSGVWLDVTGGDVFHMEANALGATAGVGRVRLLARQVLSLLFDLPLSSDERQLAMIVLRPGLLGFSWQPERDAVAVILNSVGSSEQASAPWWKGRMLWSASNGTAVERVSQHSVVLTVPGRMSRTLYRQKSNQVQLWNFIFPASLWLLGVASFGVRGGYVSGILYIGTALVHMLVLRGRRRECQIPVFIPRNGCLVMLLLVVGLKWTLGHPLQAQQQEVLCGIALLVLFCISGSGDKSVREGPWLLFAATTAAASLCFVLPSAASFLVRALTSTDTHAMDLGVACCLSVGLLQLLAAKIWSNHANVRFAVETGIEMHLERSQEAAKKADPFINERGPWGTAAHRSSGSSATAAPSASDAARPGGAVQLDPSLMPGAQPLAPMGSEGRTASAVFS
eukprot:TRINITY_DN28364_c0_g2_i1.p1 TRINITY_DN28364_c0_g2~~TRINITY_DN28364_c0_g2_i1.p1  ORF type:complete len:679 (-),score=125.50 TRINITY_DN28364_c0_g2_i1:24-2060(-)